MRKAAELGNWRAQGFMGGRYYEGFGVPKDYVESYAWLNIAVIRGDEDSQKLLRTVAALLTPEQISRAQARSTQLHKEIEARKAKK